jgi:hypothetical protein
MFKRMLLAGVLIITVQVLTAQIKSPDEFLGYKIGSRYTPHWKIVNYVNHIATAAPGMVKLQSYGETNEGRPLLLAFVSSADNIKNLESIRLNNLRLANSAKDKMAAIEENAPAIVWLSYNVHGNETSSSEAAMLTLYALVDPSNNKTKEWLKNTVVVIDPCINPDGRDRYVNWFNSIAGTVANPQLAAREHREPWPGGRTNHYNFDLNRDWAWQTQIESQQRLKVYNQWLPQIHVDYHEQGVNEPYYFAPAAQPFHEVITPWQREFQVSIGKNHAKYFDSNGWLYFTREVFDLYYPSYGDTYPTYNGAIGMTYEQGGGPAGGLAAINDEGDTLTLLDRVMHHYTTGLSTIEISSVNAGKLIKEFRKYFNDAVSSGVGEYKTYIVRYKPADMQRLYALFDLLDKNGIRYGVASEGSGKGFNYSTGKEESFKIDAGSIIVSAIQPKSALVKALFEPRPKLVDSVTYDITAWSIPYAYGLDAFASRDKINAAGDYNVPYPNGSAKAAAYGYVIRWEGVQSARAAGQLLQKGIRLRFCEQPFESGDQKFERGSVLVLRTGNEKFGSALENMVSGVCKENKLLAYPVATGFVDKGYDFGSDKVHPLKAPKVALLTGEGISSGGAGEIWHFFDKQLSYPITLINLNDFSRVSWNDFDVLIMSSGNYRFLSDKASTDAFKDWINKGGRVVAIDAAVGALAKAEFGIKLKKEEEDKKNDKETYEALKRFEDRERDGIVTSTPGSIFKVELDNTHPLAYGYPAYYYTLKMDDNIYEFLKDGWNVGVIKKDNQVAGFVGAKLKDKLKDGLLFGVQSMGNGSVTYLADDLLFRSFWENGKLMLCNAVFLVGQ